MSSYSALSHSVQPDSHRLAPFPQVLFCLITWMVIIIYEKFNNFHYYEKFSVLFWNLQIVLYIWPIVAGPMDFINTSIYVFSVGY